MGASRRASTSGSHKLTKQVVGVRLRWSVVFWCAFAVQKSDSLGAYCFAVLRARLTCFRRSAWAGRGAKEDKSSLAGWLAILIIRAGRQSALLR